MPITVPNTAAITAAVQAMLNSQKTALDVTINAARDNVNANVDADAATLVGVVNAARDVVNANTDSKATAINNNTDAKTSAVTTAVNAKGVVKSVQRGTAAPNSGYDSTLGSLSVTVAAVNPAKSVLTFTGSAASSQGATSNYSAKIVSATQIDFMGWRYSSGHVNNIEWQLTEYF